MPVDFDKIRKLREAKGWSYAQAAKEAGFASRQIWYQIEMKIRPNVTVDTLDKMAKALGVKAKDLLK